MRILITGAAGFIGNRVAVKLHQQGLDVTGVLHKDKGLSYPFKTVVCDLESRIDIGDAYDVIVHCAGVKPRRASEIASYEYQNFKEYKRGNIDTMENIVEYARRVGVKKIINISTIGIYGEVRTSVLDEESDMINVDKYGSTKYVAECLLRESGIENISLRCPGVIGKGASDIWFTNTINKILKNEEISIYAPDFEIRNFVWVDDLVDFIHILLNKQKYEYEYIVIGSEKKTTINKMLAEMFRLIESKSIVKEEPGIRKPFCINSSKAISMGYNATEPEAIVGKYLGEITNG